MWNRQMYDTDTKNAALTNQAKFNSYRWYGASVSYLNNSARVDLLYIFRVGVGRVGKVQLE